MSVDNTQFIDSALGVYYAEVRKAIKAQEDRLKQLQESHTALQQTMETVQQLPAKLQQQVMVPFGRHAFFPGQLTRTNELLVHLGDQYYVEGTAVQVHAILQRKLAVIAGGIAKAQQQQQSLQARLEVAGSSLKDNASGEDAIEIRSSVEESDALLATAVRKSHEAAAAAGAEANSSAALPESEYRALQARLDELIRLEEQQETEEEHLLQLQQQQQQTELETIAEDEEDAAELISAAAPGSTKVAAAQHIQQLENEPDSDDEDQPHLQQQEQQRKLQHLASGDPQQILSQMQSSSQLQSSLVAKPAPATSCAGSGVSGSRSAGAQLKPALKRGFLMPPSSTCRSQPVAAKSSANARGASSGSGSSSAAFTGAVMERTPLAVAVPGLKSGGSGAVGSVVATAATTGSASAQKPVPSTSTRLSEVQQLSSSCPTSRSSDSSRPSEFMLRRMGLEPPVDG